MCNLLHDADGLHALFQPAQRFEVESDADRDVFHLHLFWGIGKTRAADQSGPTLSQLEGALQNFQGKARRQTERNTEDATQKPYSRKIRRSFTLLCAHDITLTYLSVPEPMISTLGSLEVMM